MIRVVCWVKALLSMRPQVSQISSVFDCLLEEEERSLKDNPVDSVQWAEVVLTVNTIIKVQHIHYFMMGDSVLPKRETLTLP